MLSGRRQRAARKPITLTTRKMIEAMMISARWSLIVSALPTLGEVVDDQGGGHAQQDEGQLQPVEARETQEVRVLRVEQEDQQRYHDGNDQQPVPGGGTSARHRPGLGLDHGVLLEQAGTGGPAVIDLP